MQGISEHLLKARAGYGYIPGLDGVRCLAVALVMVAHAGYERLVPGGLGVTIFFFISGFLITRLLLAEADAKGRIGLGNFYIRRFLRLLPALYVMLAVTSAVLVFVLATPPLFAEVATALTYTANYLFASLQFQDAAAAAGQGLPGVRVAPWSHLWSLAIEEHFYLLFPLVLMLNLQRPKRMVWICLALCVAALAWRLATLHILHWPSQYNYVATDTRIDSLVWGCLLSILLHVSPDGAWRRWLVGAAPVVLAAILMLGSLMYRDEAFRESFRYTIQGIALFIGILNLYFWRPVAPVVRVLELPLMSWLGRVSYGLYLWHLPVYILTRRIAGDQLSQPAFILFAVSVTLLATSLSYYLIERPIVALRQRFGAHIPRPGAVQESANS
ncbi:MAG: acyltransferase [Hyphomonas sp.]